MIKKQKLETRVESLSNSGSGSRFGRMHALRSQSLHNAAKLGACPTGGKAGEMANAICDSRKHPLDAWGIGYSMCLNKRRVYNVRAEKKTRSKNGTVWKISHTFLIFNLFKFDKN